MPRTQWKQQIVGLRAVGLLGMPISWVAWSAIAPPVQAYVARADVILDVPSDAAYPAFLSRAETVARAAIQRSFDRDILISAVYVMIVGQRRGQSAPVLTVRVSREHWRARPDARLWATYFPSAKGLLLAC